MITANMQENNKTIWFKPNSYTYLVPLPLSNPYQIIASYNTTQNYSLNKVQSLYVDNSQSNTETTININNTQQNIIVSAQSIAIYPIFLNDNSIITISNSNANSCTLTLIFVEKTMQPAVLSGNNVNAIVNLLNTLINTNNNSFNTTDTTISKELLNQTTNFIATEDLNINKAFNTTQKAIQTLNSNTFAIPPYDYVAYTYNSSNQVTQAQYYQGGASGTLVATLTYTYSGSNVSSIALTPTI